jgi:hypothetical protein
MTSCLRAVDVRPVLDPTDYDRTVVLDDLQDHSVVAAARDSPALERGLQGLGIR